MPHGGHRGFRFVSRSTFVIENHGFGTPFGLHLYSYNPDVVLSLDQIDNQHTSPKPTLIAVFQFPPLVSQDITLWVTMIGYLSARGAHAFNGSQSRRAFEISSSRRILIIQVCWYFDPSLRLHSYIVCTDPSVFQNYVPRTQVDPEALPEIIPWSSWGPQHTRWFSDDSRIGPDFNPRSYGTRVLLPGRLLDFNTRDVGRDISYARRNGEDRYAGTLVGRDTPTVLPAGLVFREEIVSDLPYRELPLGDLGPLWQIYPGEDWMHL